VAVYVCSIAQRSSVSDYKSNINLNRLRSTEPELVFSLLTSRLFGDIMCLFGEVRRGLRLPSGRRDVSSFVTKEHLISL
jgi:hypothetical protein